CLSLVPARAPRPCLLERHLVVILRPRRGGGGAGGLAGGAGIAAALVVALAVEHFHHLGDDLGAVLFLVRFLVFPTVGADGALDVDELPLAEELAADLGELAPGDNVVPL